MQNAGRANRIDPNATLSGAFINNSNVNTIDDVRIGCEYEQQRDSLLNSDYLKSILALEACCKVITKLILLIKRSNYYQMVVRLMKFKVY